MAMNARQMLAGLPVRMADGGAVTDAQIREFLAANAGASDAQIAQVMNQYGVTPVRLAAAAGYDPQEVTRRYEAALPLTAAEELWRLPAMYVDETATPPAWTPGESLGRQRAIESGNEANWLAQVKASADAYMARATPATAAEAYDAMVQSGIGIKDLLDAGVSQMTIDKALSIETDAEQKAVNRLAATSLTNTLAQNPNIAGELAARGAQDVYSQSRQFVENLQKDGLTDDERRYLQQVASQQGWGYADIRAAGVDPTLLFDNTAAREAERQRLAAEAERQRLAGLAAAEAERQRLAGLSAAEAERQRLAAAEAERQRLAAAEAERQRLAGLAAAEAERQRLAAAEAERQRLAGLAAAEAERQRLAGLAAAEAERQRLAGLAAAEAERQRLADAQVVAPGVTTGDMVKAVTPTYSANALRDIIKAAENQPAPLGTITNPMDTRGSAETGSQSGVSQFLETYAAPIPFTPSEPYTPPKAYDPEKFARENAGEDLYAKGQPALDTAFRESPVRTVSPVTGQYVYTPAASLRPATGSGWSWTPPVVTSRPRQLLDVAPTASASQLYAQSRQEQDRALRNAFTAAKIPLGGQDVYSWQSRLRSGDYTSPTGAFDTTRFNQDFESWAAGRGSGTSGTSGQPGALAYDAMGNPIQPVDPMQLQPKMFLGFADGGDVRARELLDRLKKPEGAEEQVLGAEDTYSQEPGTLGFVSEKVGRGARALRDVVVNLTPLSQMEEDATRISLEHFPDSRQYGGESDALRHMLFQAQAVQRFGQPAAKALSLINEYGLAILESQPKEHLRMDLENDALGREIGLSDLSEEEKLQAILDLIGSGKAVVLNPQRKEFAKGGEASASPTPEELLAQIDRSMANSPASAQGIASSVRPDSVEQDSRSMLRRISDAFGQNVTAPVVGSMLDMTAGVGDLAQMGIKAGAKKLGIETQPFTPVSSAIQESLGVAGYDPYSPAAIATAIGLPAAASLRAAGAAARGSRPLMLSEAVPRTGRRRPPAPGSAEELLSRLAPIVDKEASIFAGSELAAMGAREVAPDNFTAEIAAAIAGGGAYNTLDNILSSSARTADMGAPTTARSQMAEIFSHTPTRENPFVGRLDNYVANLPGKIGRDQLLAQMKGRFRASEILRVERALEDVDPNAKLQPTEILEKIKQEYDPSDLTVTTITPEQFRSSGRQFYSSMDNPWVSLPPELEPEQGVIVLSRPLLSGRKRYTKGQVKDATDALSNLNLMFELTSRGGDTVPAEDMRVYLESLASPLSRSLYNSEAIAEDERQSLLGIVDKMERSYLIESDIEQTLGSLAADVIPNQAQTPLGSRNALVGNDEFNAEKNRLLAQGGLEPSQVINQAYVNVFKRRMENDIQLTYPRRADWSATRDIIKSLPKPDNVTTPAEADAFLSDTFLPAIQSAIERARYTRNNQMAGYVEDLRDSGVDKVLRQVIEGSKVQERIGVNPDYVGQHGSLTGTQGGQIGFSRTSDVVASISGMNYARGIYLHEMQSDLLDDINTRQGRVASGATLAEVKKSIPRIEEKISNTFKEKAGDAFAENEEVMGKLLNDLLANPSGRTNIVSLYETTYPELWDVGLSRLTRSISLDSLIKARRRVEELQQPEASRRTRTSEFALDEAFPGMMSDSKTLQQMLMKTAVHSAMDRGMNFVAFTIPERPYSSQPQLYERVPQNARDVVKDLGEGFRLEQIRMRSPRDYSSNSFPVLAITWDQSTTEGREGVNRIRTQGLPFRHGGEVTTQPDDLKNLLSFLDKKPAHKRK